MTDSSNLQQNKAKPDHYRRSVLIKPATYDGTTSWLDYKSHFEACANLGHWCEEDNALYMAVSLRGQAQSVLGGLGGEAPKKYDDLITALRDFLLQIKWNSTEHN